MKKAIAISLIGASALLLGACGNEDYRKKCIDAGGEYIKVWDSYSCIAELNGKLVQIKP